MVKSPNTTLDSAKEKESIHELCVKTGNLGIIITPYLEDRKHL